jgi:hypothetical protein
MPDYSEQDSPPESKRSPVAYIGCFILALILGLCVGAGFLIKEELNTAIFEATKEQLQNLSLPIKQKRAINRQIDRLKSAYDEGKVTMKEVVVILTDLAKGPIVNLYTIKRSLSMHLPKSHLSKARQKTARRDFQRFARGVFDRQIDELAIGKVILLVCNVSSEPVEGPEPPLIKQKLSNDDVDAFVSMLKKAADKAQIPDKNYEFDIAKELTLTIDKILK